MTGEHILLRNFEITTLCSDTEFKALGKILGKSSHLHGWDFLPFLGKGLTKRLKTSVLLKLDPFLQSRIKIQSNGFKSDEYVGIIWDGLKPGKLATHQLCTSKVLLEEEEFWWKIPSLRQNWLPIQGCKTPWRISGKSTKTLRIHENQGILTLMQITNYIIKEKRFWE